MTLREKERTPEGAHPILATDQSAQITSERITLSATEMVRKSTLVAVVDRTIASFVKCGEALQEILDSKLYRDETGTFAEFVEARWGLSSRRARQLMAATEIVNALPSGTAVPLTERQVRELMELRDWPELMAEALAFAALDRRGINSNSIANAVQMIVEREAYIEKIAAGSFFGLPRLGDVIPRDFIACSITVDIAARFLYQTGKMAPRPAVFAEQWAFAGDPDRAWNDEVAAIVDAFRSWLFDTGIGSSDPIDGGVDWDDDVLNRWCPVDDFTVEDRRTAAVGHWHSMNSFAGLVTS